MNEGQEKFILKYIEDIALKPQKIEEIYKSQSPRNFKREKILNPNYFKDVKKIKAS